MSKPHIKILCPKDFTPEKTYIIDVIFGEFLGLNYNLEFTADTEHYRIEINNSVILIEDHFFSRITEREGYLHLKYIPKDIQQYSNREFDAENLPVFYGNPHAEVEGNTILFQMDIFACCFFMLTRWEEYVLKDRDAHDRFPVQHSLAFKHGFLDRPVVNEYVEMLRKALLILDPALSFKKWEFECVPTHDIDHIRKWGSLADIRKKLAHDFITLKRPLVGLKNIADMLLSVSRIKKDPYDTIKYIADLSVQNNLTSHFYFLCGGTSSHDNNYNIEKARPVFEYLKSKNQIIGLHPSYSSYNNPEQWHFEKSQLERLTNKTVTEGRQHYLRFEVPGTWEMWNNEGMSMDSTVGYADLPGFRCGTCYPFSVFNFITRKQLNLKENPLILMETTLISYMKLSPKKANETAKKLYFTVKKYNGNFTFLWHNSAMHTVEDKPYLYIYENIIKGFPEDGE